MLPGVTGPQVLFAVTLWHHHVPHQLRHRYVWHVTTQLRVRVKSVFGHYWLWKVMWSLFQLFQMLSPDWFCAGWHCSCVPAFSPWRSLERLMTLRSGLPFPDRSSKCRVTLFLCFRLSFHGKAWSAWWCRTLHFRPLNVTLIHPLTFGRVPLWFHEDQGVCSYLSFNLVWYWGLRCTPPATLPVPPCLGADPLFSLFV